jgi:hypothetical protein
MLKMACAGIHAKELSDANDCMHALFAGGLMS